MLDKDAAVDFESPGFVPAMFGFQGTLYFVFTAPSIGQRLYKTDGKSSAVYLQQFDTAAPEDDSAPTQLPRFLAMGDNVYFTDSPGLHLKLWKTNGTIGGTKTAVDFRGTEVWYADDLLATKKAIYLIGYGDRGETVMRTQGTRSTTAVLGRPGEFFPPDDFGPELKLFGNSLYFSNAGDLWRASTDAPSTIQGTVFNDTNHDGLRDHGETGLAGFGVYLDLNRDGQYEKGEPKQQSDELGRYYFEGIDPGKYRVGLTLPDGFIPITATEFSTTVAANGSSTKNFGAVPIQHV